MNQVSVPWLSFCENGETHASSPVLCRARLAGSQRHVFATMNADGSRNEAVFEWKDSPPRSVSSPNGDRKSVVEGKSV